MEFSCIRQVKRYEIMFLDFVIRAWNLNIDSNEKAGLSIETRIAHDFEFFTLFRLQLMIQSHWW